MGASTGRMFGCVLLLLLLLYVGAYTVSACLTSSHPPNNAPEERISVRGRWLVDGHGRVRIFHGVNEVMKAAPWYPPDLTDRHLDYYQKWGFNVMRLGAMWTGVQPSAGTTNTTYLNVLKDIVKRAAKRGIYVLLDMHQDVISSAFDSYDGVPRWVIDKMPPSHHKYPWPLTHPSQWADGYLTEAVGNAFQCLYNNTAGTRDDFARFWMIMAQAFKAMPSIIGYELINEPWAGDIYQRPGLLLPGEAGRSNLAPLYEHLNAAIRQVDNETIIFYEPVTWGMVVPGTGVLGNGFKTVPGGAAYANRSVFSWHYYCWILTADDDKKPYNSFKRAVCDKTLAPMVFQTVDTDIKRTGGGSFLTEFGTCEPDGNKNDTQTIECEFVLSRADEHLQSWTYWYPDFFNKTTDEVRYEDVRPFARVYAPAIAGIPKYMNFNLTTRIFNLTFTLDRSILAPTEIMLPGLQYPAGFVVEVSPGMRWTYDLDTYMVLVTVDQDNMRDGNGVYKMHQSKEQGSMKRDSDVTVIIRPW